MLDIELLEVDRNTARHCITPPSSVQAFPLNSRGGATGAGHRHRQFVDFGSTGFSARVLRQVRRMFPVGGGRALLLTMPSASATFSAALSPVKSGRQILMRGRMQGRNIFVGQRFPVTLSPLSTSRGNDMGAAVSSTVFARTDLRWEKFRWQW
jgi:hypothetical protein